MPIASTTTTLMTKGKRNLFQLQQCNAVPMRSIGFRNGFFCEWNNSPALVVLTGEMTKNVNSFRSLLFLTSKQRKVCKTLQANRGRLYRMAYAWTHNGDVADEVVQETMIKAIQKIDQLENINALNSWLFRVMSNCFIDICRKREEHIDIEDIVLFDEETPESIHSRSEMLASVRAAIARLPLKHRQVLTLIDLESFTYAEVSEILMVPIGTIMSRLNRARQSLKQMLDKEHKNQDSKSPLRLVK